MTDLTSKLNAAEASFNQVNEEMKNLQEQVNEGNRLIAAKREELLRLQGEHRVLKSLSEEKPKEEKKKS